MNFSLGSILKSGTNLLNNTGNKIAQGVISGAKDLGNFLSSASINGPLKGPSDVAVGKGARTVYEDQLKHMPGAIANEPGIAKDIATGVVKDAVGIPEASGSTLTPTKQIVGPTRPQGQVLGASTSSPVAPTPATTTPSTPSPAAMSVTPSAVFGNNPAPSTAKVNRAFVPQSPVQSAAAPSATSVAPSSFLGGGFTPSPAPSYGAFSNQESMIKNLASNPETNVPSGYVVTPEALSLGSNPRMSRRRKVAGLDM